jgi:MFS transporter, MHS family, shikimate and dehydroshikimate transport protein
MTSSDSPTASPAPATASRGGRTAAEKRRAAKRVLVSSFIGSVVEWYDFMLYGTAAALVFNQLFFSALDSAAGQIASFGTLAVGYLARPLGGVIFGHFGDRIGRKAVLVTTILTMGVATILIGFLPTYDQIGVWAPALLVLLRILQGFAVGGEWGGAVLITLEHAKSERRGLWSSIAQLGAPAGLLLSTGVFSAVSMLPKAAFLSWGWRVPFLLTVVLIGVGLWMRLGVEESPVFLAAQRAVKAATDAKRLPIVELFRRHPREVVLAAVVGLGPFFANAILISFVLSYAGQVGHSRTESLNALLIASGVSMISLPLFAALSDRYGRRPVYTAGALLLAINSFALFPLVNTGKGILLVLGYTLALVVHSMMYGPMGAFMAELFGTEIRYTGASVGYQVASVAGGFGPLLATILLDANGGAPHALYVSCFMAGILALTAVASIASKETHRRDLLGSASEDESQCRS